MCSHPVNKYFSEILDGQSTLGTYSMLSGRGLFRKSPIFPPREPRWLFSNSQLRYTLCDMFLSTLLSSRPRRRSNIPSCHDTFPSYSNPCLSPFLPNDSTSQATSQDTILHHLHQLRSNWCTVFIPPVIATDLAAVGLAIKSNSSRSQRRNGNTLEDACLRQSRMKGIQ